MQDGLLFLFLFIALALGWLLGTVFNYRKLPLLSKLPESEDRSNSKHRLQLLFDSYTDESLESFIESLEVKPETLALHISIGKHFRTQGEVDKAILIHQNLMSHPELAQEHTDPVVYELAKDYKAAGLFDRSESLLEQLLSSRAFSTKARTLLLEIYELQKDWLRAYELSLQFDIKRDSILRTRIAQYCCELACEKEHTKHFVEARKFYLKALSFDKQCVRAMFCLADLAFAQGDVRSSITRLREVIERMPEYMGLALERLLECTKANQSYEQYEAYLRSCYQRTRNVQVALALFDYLYDREPKDALDLIESVVHEQPNLNTLKLLLEATTDEGHAPSTEVWALLNDAIDSISNDLPAYLCDHCGFSGQQLHWRCPSCHHWQSIKPFELDASLRVTR